MLQLMTKATLFFCQGAFPGVKSIWSLFMAERFFTILLLITIAGCTKQNIALQGFKKNEQIIHYSQTKNIENISNYVIYLDKGDKIPLRITLDSEVIEVDNEKINLVLKQKVYFRLRMPEGISAEYISAMSAENRHKFFKNLMIFISLDAKSWAPYTDIKAVKKVLGLKGGSVSFGVGITKQAGLEIFLNARTTKNPQPTISE